MPASYTSGQRSILAGIQPAELRRKEVAVPSTPSHGFLTSPPLSALLSIEWKCTASQIETPILYPLLNNS